MALGIFGVLLLLWNIAVLIIYAIDKLHAKSSKRRIREATLLALAFLFGSAGAMFGMVICNHKTSKTKFRILIPLAVMLNAALAVMMLPWISM